jgi:hypothetical protein
MTDWVQYGALLLAKHNHSEPLKKGQVRCEVVFRKADDARIDAAVDQICDRIAKQIYDSGIITKARRERRANAMPNTLSPTEEAAKLLKEYAIDKRAKEAAGDVGSVHKLNAEPELRSDHYSELMKRVAARDAAEIAKVRAPRVQHAQPDTDTETMAEKIARYMKAGLNWDQAATKAMGPPNAQERFATTSETDINGGSPRRVSGANINPRPLSP